MTTASTCETLKPSVVWKGGKGPRNRCDDRVDPLHARKFTAAMQDASAGGPVLLRIEKNAGHGGADMVKAGVEKLADEYAFALSEMDK